MSLLSVIKDMNTVVPLTIFVYFSATVDVLDGICQFMTTQTVEKRTPWKLILPSNVFNAIDFLK